MWHNIGAGSGNLSNAVDRKMQIGVLPDSRGLESTVIESVEKYDRKSIAKIKALRNAIEKSHKRLKFKYFEYASYCVLLIALVTLIVLNRLHGTYLDTAKKTMKDQLLASNLAKPIIAAYSYSLISRLDRYTKVDGSNYPGGRFIQYLPFTFTYTNSTTFYENFWQLKIRDTMMWPVSDIDGGKTSPHGTYKVYPFIYYILISIRDIYKLALRSGELNSNLTYGKWAKLEPVAYSGVEMIFNIADKVNDGFEVNSASIHSMARIKLYSGLLFCLIIGRVYN